MNEIVVGVDGSPTARVAAEHAAELAAAYQRPLHLVLAHGGRRSSAEVTGGGGERWHVDSISSAEEMLRSLSVGLPTATPVTQAVVPGDPATALCDEAARLDASVIVVGNKRVQGAARVLGSIAGDVAKRAPCNVYIVHTH